MKAADLQVKKAQAERRQKLSDLATTAEQQQQYVGTAVQAQAAFDSSQQQVDQAEINLRRTEIKSPVSGFVTNLLMRVGDYAKEGTTNISVIDADSYWIDGYFEETKMARVCVGDRVEAQLMGYRQPIVGRVSTVTRGISVSDAAPSTQGLPNVDPIYTWVRLAQRVPVRVAITDMPPGIPLVSGMTATVTVTGAEAREGGGWWGRRWSELKQHFDDIFHPPQLRSECVPALGPSDNATVTLPTPEPSKALAPDQVAPGLTPSLTASPKPLR